MCLYDAYLSSFVQGPVPYLPLLFQGVAASDLPTNRYVMNGFELPEILPLLKPLKRGSGGRVDVEVSVSTQPRW